MTAGIFDDLRVDHIRCYTSDVEEAEAWLRDGYGLHSHAVSAAGADEESVALARGGIRFVFTRPQVADHPGTAYLQRHGDGVADIALGVGDVVRAFTTAVERGSRPVSAPVRREGVVTATIAAFGDVTHTFVQRLPGTDPLALPGLSPAPRVGSGLDSRLAEIDHFAVCVEPGTMAATVQFYERVLDFTMIFQERIAVGDQAIDTQAIQSRSGAVTFTLIEPDPACAPGQIDAFLKDHGGPGVQHVALRTDDIIASVSAVSGAGMEFLTTPDAYYRLLAERMRVDRHPQDELRRWNVLVDQDHGGQLFQIFAASRHPRGTLFLELIERLGARSFGNGNIAALYEAVELQRIRDEVS